MRPATHAVHAGRDDLSTLGVHALPIDLSTTYPVRPGEDPIPSLEAMVEGAAPSGNPVYSRLHQPTVARFEHAIAELEGGDAAVAFGSGMAALTAVLLAARARGGHIVAVRPMYGTSDHLISSGLLGLDAAWTDQDHVADARRPDTALVLIETPANPTLDLVDIAHVVRQAGPVPVVVDSTFATPVLQQPLVHGAAMVLHSATKFLGGHGDVLAGVVIASEAHVASLRQIRLLTGGVLHPLGGYLLHRGLATLPIRVQRAQATARELAVRLAAHPAVERVRYPGLPGGDPRLLLGRQLAGPGTMLGFELRTGAEARRVVDALELITQAVSLGSVDTLIQQPAALTHHVVDPATRHASGIADGLLRLSVGLEDAEDLWADLDQALTAERPQRRPRRRRRHQTTVDT
ncbi:MAG: PLP-dependent aspartate aminotransferase family protein [Gemmatimonadales bacterium]